MCVSGAELRSAGLEFWQTGAQLGVFFCSELPHFPQEHTHDKAGTASGRLIHPWHHRGRNNSDFSTWTLLLPGRPVPGVRVLAVTPSHSRGERACPPLGCGPFYLLKLIAFPGISPSPSNFFFFCFLGPHQLGVKSELQLLTTATATPDPSHIYHPHHCSQQHQILNLLSEVRDQT